MRLAYLHYLVEGDTGLHHVRQFAAGARRLGHQIDVCAMNLAPGNGLGADDRRGRTPWRARLKRRFSFWLHEPKEVAWNFLYIRSESRLLRRLRPDLLLVRDHLLTVSCVPVARRLGLPLVLEVNSPADESRLYLDDYLHLPYISGAFEGYKVRRADAVTVVSSSLKDDLVRRHGVEDQRISIVPNGADIERFHPGVAPDRDLGRPGGAPVIGFVGSFRKWHGTDFMARVLLEIARLRPAVGFLLVGAGPEEGAVRSALAPLGARARFTGAVPHARVPALTTAFDIGLMPESNHYGSPLKVIEWMAAGRAIAAPAYAPLRDVIDHGREGLLFRPRALEDVVACLLRLVDDPGLRVQLGAAAAARARASLSWTENARRVLAACERALAGRRET